MARIPPRLAILGAGPVGLEAALLARKLNWPVMVFERGRIGENLERWGFVRLFSPFGMNSTELGRLTIKSAHPGHQLPAENDLLTGREHVAGYLMPLATSPLLADFVKTETQVIGVAKPGLMKTDATDKRNNLPFRLLLRDKQGQESYAEADVVFDCTGTFGNGRFLGDGGIPAAGELAARSQIASGLEDVLGGQRNKYAGKTILLIGAGYSAATHVDLLAQLAQTSPETWIIWLARGPRSQPMPRHPSDPLKERDRLAARANSLATRGEGNVEFHASAIVDRITSLGQDKGFQVTARVAGQLKSWDVDRIIANVGYRPDTSLYRELQVQECPNNEGPIGMATQLVKQSGSDCLHHSAGGIAALKTTEPNFFILGSKSYGRNSQFLMKSGFEQIRDVMAHLAGKSLNQLA
jgi:hypothetical protein